MEQAQAVEMVLAGTGKQNSIRKVNQILKNQIYNLKKSEKRTYPKQSLREFSVKVYKSKNKKIFEY